MGQGIVGVISSQKIYGLYGLKHHIVETMLDVTLCGGQTDGQRTECEDWARNRICRNLQEPSPPNNFLTLFKVWDELKRAISLS